MMVVDGHCWSPVQATRAGQKTMSKAGKNDLVCYGLQVCGRAYLRFCEKKTAKKSGTESADKKERNRESEKVFCRMMLKTRNEFMKQCQVVFLS